MSLIALLADDEGKRLKVYRDSRGFMTVGIGHNVDANGLPPKVAASVLARADLTDQECADLFADDIEQAQAALFAFFPVAQRLDEVRQAVLLDMMFNLGAPTFRTFVTFQSCVRQAFFGSADGWKRAAEDLRGTKAYAELPVRYERLAKMLETGQWPQELTP